MSTFVDHGETLREIQELAIRTRVHEDLHTRRDSDELRAAGFDPDDVENRERRVECKAIGCSAQTANVAGGCDRHYEAPPAMRRALAVVA